MSVVNVGTSEAFPRVVESPQQSPRAKTETTRSGPSTRRRAKSASCDELTGLATRSGFLARLQRSVAPGWCIEGLFVLLLDLDRFREINDRYGYTVADRLLAEVGARLKRRLRPTDVVARFGPDEFAVLLAGVGSGREVAGIAERLLRELEPPVEVDLQRLKASASIGVAMGVAGERPEDMVRNAERALARAKLLGRSNYQIFQSETAARETSLQQVETALRRALDQEEFRSRFRPTVVRKEGSVASFEVLLWRRAPSPADDVSAQRTVDNERGGALPRRADDVSTPRTAVVAATRTVVPEPPN